MEETDNGRTNKTTKIGKWGFDWDKAICNVATKRDPDNNVYNNSFEGIGWSYLFDPGEEL